MGTTEQTIRSAIDSLRQAEAEGGRDGPAGLANPYPAFSPRWHAWNDGALSAMGI